MLITEIAPADSEEPELVVDYNPTSLTEDDSNSNDGKIHRKTPKIRHPKINAIIEDVNFFVYCLLTKVGQNIFLNFSDANFVECCFLKFKTAVYKISVNN